VSIAQTDAARRERFADVKLRLCSLSDVAAARDASPMTEKSGGNPDKSGASILHSLACCCPHQVLMRARRFVLVAASQFLVS